MKFIEKIQYFLPERIIYSLSHLSQEEINSTFEIRLNIDKPIVLFGRYGTKFLCNSNLSQNIYGSVTISKKEIEDVFNKLCSYSVYTFQNSINQGYITTKYGDRVGICGTAVCENGQIKNIKDISSLNVRISREIIGCSSEIFRNYLPKNDSVIIAGKPCSGKTTVIRDMINRLCSGIEDKYYKVVVCDERGEIAGVCNGKPTKQTGITSYVLDGYPLKNSMDIAVRTLSPEIIVCDEISKEEEITTIRQAVNSGVRFIVTVHADNYDEIISRCQIKELLETFSFNKLFLLSDINSEKLIKNVYNKEELLYEINNRLNLSDELHYYRNK